jgi:hypothetical protein
MNPRKRALTALFHSPAPSNGCIALQKLSQGVEPLRIFGISLLLVAAGHFPQNAPMATIHIIGAGISGLAAATLLAEKHLPVKLYEASTHAGGRCRTGRDRDHGLHVIGARDAQIHAYLERIGSAEQFVPVRALPLPRAPLADYLPFLRWLRSRGNAGDMIGRESVLRDEWFVPYARTQLAALPDTVPSKALRRQLLRDGSKKRMARLSLDESFVRPALEFIEYRGGSVYFSHALTRIERADTQLKALVFARKKVPLEADDIVILATPPAFTQQVVGGSLPEQAHCAITMHFEVEHREAEGIAYPLEAPMDLLRYRAGGISAGIRIADHTWHSDEDALAQRLWKAIGKRHPYLHETPLPDYTLWREKKAGHAVADTPAIASDRGQILLAGDWLDPLTPASLEAAAASGHTAAKLAIGKLPDTPAHRQRRPF